METFGRRSLLVLVGMLSLLAAAFFLVSSPAVAAPIPQDYDPGNIFNDLYNDSSSALNITANQSQRLLFYLDCGSPGDMDWMYVWLPAGQNLSILLEAEDGANFRFQTALKTPEIFDVVNVPLRPQIAGANQTWLNTTTYLDGPYYLSLDGIASCVTPPNFYNVTWSATATTSPDDGDNSRTTPRTIVSGGTISSSLTETSDQAEFFTISATVTPPSVTFLKIRSTTGVASGARLELYNATSAFLPTPMILPGWDPNSTMNQLQANGYRFDVSDTLYFRLWSNGQSGPYTLVFDLSIYAPSDTNLDFTTAHAVQDNANFTSFLNYSFERNHYWKVFVNTPRTLWVEVFSNEVDVGFRLHSELQGTLARPPRATRDLGLVQANNPKDYQALSYYVTAAEYSTVTGWYYINVSIVNFIPQGNFTVHFYFEDAPVGTPASYTIDEDNSSIGTIPLAPRFTDLDCTQNSSDPDCSPTITMITAPTANLTFTYSGGAFVDVVPDANWSGIECAVFRARDSWGQSATAQICVTVNAMNDPPSITAFMPTDISMVEDQALSGVLVDTWFFDIDGDTLTVSFTGDAMIQPNIFPASGHLEAEFTPVANWNGQETITFCADDVLTVVCAPVVFSVAAVNDKPTSRGNIAQYTYAEDTSFFIDLAAISIGGTVGAAFVDIDGDTLSYRVSQVTEVTVIVNGTLLNITPNPNFNGLASFYVKGYDGTEESQDSSAILIRFTEVNDLPTISSRVPVPDPAIKEGENRAFSVVAADVDIDETYTYLWQVNGVGITNAVTSTYTYGVPLTTEGNRTVTIRVVVTDSKGGQVETTWIVNAENVNQAPSASITSPTTFTFVEGAEIVFSSQASDADSDTVSYTWYSSRVATPIGTDSTFSRSLGPGTHEIRLIVTDGLLQGEANVTLTVTAKPAGPTPGFEAPFVLAAMAAAVAVAVVLRRRRR